jgi:hypothetical protein
MRLIAYRTARLGGSPMLLRLLLEDIRLDELFVEILGKSDRIATKRYPQALAAPLRCAIAGNATTCSRSIGASG